MEASLSTSHRSSRRWGADLTFSSLQAGRGFNAKLDGRQSWHSDSWSCRSLRTHNTQLASVIYLQMLCRVSTHRQAQEFSILICIRLCSRAFIDRHSSGNWHWNRALAAVAAGTWHRCRARAAAAAGTWHWSLAVATTTAGTWLGRRNSASGAEAWNGSVQGLPHQWGMGTGALQWPPQ